MSPQDELLTLNQIALRAGVQPSAVSNWKRRYPDDFPRPRDRDLYSAREVDAWLDRRQLGRSSQRRSLEAKLFEATDRLRGHADVRTAFAAILTAVTVASLRPDVVETGNVFEAAVDIERAGEAPRGSLCGPLDQFANDERATQALEDIVLGMGGEDPTRAFESLLSRGLQSSLAESQSSSRLRRLLAGLISRDASNVLDPACGVGGLLLNHFGFELPETALPIALALLIGGILFLVAERHLKGRTGATEITWAIAVAVGVGQLIAAVFPGASRSGTTILLALFMGLSRPAAIEFSFLVGIPTMLAASGLKITEEIARERTDGMAEDWGILILGCVVSAIVSFAAVRWLLRYIQTHTFTAFGWYRIALAAVILAWIGFSGDPAPPDANPQPTPELSDPE